MLSTGAIHILCESTAKPVADDESSTGDNAFDGLNDYGDLIALR